MNLAVPGISRPLQVSNKYAIEDFESALLVVVGQQSAGKTTFVERQVGFASSLLRHVEITMTRQPLDTYCFNKRVCVPLWLLPGCFSDFEAARYLKFAFSKVAQGLATRRPSVLTLFPGEGTLIKVVEELPSGEKSEEKTFQAQPSSAF